MISQKYPYTDLHELNLDWILAKMKELDKKVDDMYTELYMKLTNDLHAYVNDQIAALMAEYRQLKDDFDALTEQFAELEGLFNDYKADIDSRLDAINARITAEIQGVNDRTDILIASNNQFLLDNMQEELRKLTVINFFTGENVSIQSMFDYLATLHLTDSIDYDTMAYRAKTYTELVGLNINYTNLAMHGNTLYV